MLDVRRMQVLRAVVTSGSITAAATNLGYTPSAISQQISVLEREAGLPLLDQTEQVAALAESLARAVPLPSRAAADAVHIATAAVHGMQYLLTWNCRHIANAEIAARLADLCEELGYEMPALCTPEQLMGN